MAASSTVTVCSDTNTSDAMQFEVQQEVTSTSLSNAMITQTDCVSSIDKAMNDGKLIKGKCGNMSTCLAE